VRFKKAVEMAKPPLPHSYRQGLQALQGYAKKVACHRPVKATITGSVDLDSSLAKEPEHASANRWDYGIGYKPAAGRECTVWIEVHGAKDREIGTVVRKARWLKEYLKHNAPDLWQLTLASPDSLRYVWLGTKGVHIPRHSPEYRRAAQEGITLHGTVLNLP